MPGKVSGFSLYFQAVILAASMKNRGGLFRLLSLTFSVCLQTLSAWLYLFSFFPQRGEVHVAFPTILRAITRASSCIDCCPIFLPVWKLFMWIMYIYICMGFMFLGGSSFPPFSTLLALSLFFADMIRCFGWILGVWTLQFAYGHIVYRCLFNNLIWWLLLRHQLIVSSRTLYVP